MAIKSDKDAKSTVKKTAADSPAPKASSKVKNN